MPDEDDDLDDDGPSEGCGSPERLALLKARAERLRRGKAPRKLKPSTTERTLMSDTAPSPLRQSKPGCREAGCSTPANTRGFCKLHYQRHVRAGDIDQVGTPSRRGSGRTSAPAPRAKTPRPAQSTTTAAAPSIPAPPVSATPSLLAEELLASVGAARQAIAAVSACLAKRLPPDEAAAIVRALLA